jgi:glucuronate isomerase
MKPFLDQDFLLQTETAKTLYHEHAKGMPIFDYHCHLPPEEIAEDKQHDNIGEIWLGGDHYKWQRGRGGLLHGRQAVAGQVYQMG